MKEINPSELFHIWKCQPCEAGDTLCGGNVTATLEQEGLIGRDDRGRFIVTDRGRRAIELMILYVERKKPYFDLDLKFDVEN